MDANKPILLDETTLVHNFTCGAIKDFIYKVRESRYFYCEKSTKVTVDCWWGAVVAMFINDSGNLDENILHILVRVFRQIWKWLRWTFAKYFLSKTKDAQSLEYEWIRELSFLAPYIQLGEEKKIEFDLDVGPPGTVRGVKSTYNIMYRDPSEPELAPPCISFRVRSAPCSAATNYCEPSTSKKAAETSSTDWYQQISLPTEPDSSPPKVTFKPIAAAMFGCEHTSEENGSKRGAKPCLLVYLCDPTNFCKPFVPRQTAEASSTDVPQFPSYSKAEKASIQQMGLPTVEPGNNNTSTHSTDEGLNQITEPKDCFVAPQPRTKKRSPGK